MGLGVKHQQAASLENQLPVTTQLAQVISPSIDAIVDVETVLHIGMVYSLQGAFINIACKVPWQAKPFTNHGEIGRACGDEVRAAIEVRTELEKYNTRWLSGKTLGRSKRLAQRRLEYV